MLRDLIDPGAAPFCPSPHSNRRLELSHRSQLIIALDHIDLLPRSILKKLIALSTDRPMIFTTETMLPRENNDIQISLARNPTRHLQKFRSAAPAVPRRALQRRSRKNGAAMANVHSSSPCLNPFVFSRR